MSMYDRLQESRDKGEEGKETCKSCGKAYTWSENGPYYPGGKDTEFIDCPYCGERHGSIRTSGFVIVNKAD